MSICCKHAVDIEWTNAMIFQMTDRAYEPQDGIVTERATFINFNAVECPIPSIHIYMIRISNNGINMSETLLFIPFDSVCNVCNVFNTTCAKKVSSYSYFP